MIFLAGCGTSPQVRFFTLDPTPGHLIARPRGSTPTQNWRIQVVGVHIPPALDRQEIVRQSGPNTLDVSDRDRWGAPLADMVREVLTRNLIERLGAEHVFPPENSAPADTYQIQVDILELKADQAGRVSLHAVWVAARSGADTPTLTRELRADRTADSADYAPEIAALSQLLGQLADQIAQETFS